MQFGVSTHLYHDARLDRDHLVEIAAHGFSAVEIFATRHACRLPRRADPGRTERAPARQRAARALGARAHHRELARRGVGAGLLAGHHRRGGANARGRRDARRARARPNSSRPRFLVLHLGVPLAQQPDGRDNRRDARAAKPRRVHGAAAGRVSGWRSRSSRTRFRMPTPWSR